MRDLVGLIKMDLILLVKYRLLAVSLFLSAGYVAVFLLFDINNYYPIISALVFSDPAMMGFIFIGVMVLYEKDQHTLQALSVCPIKQQYYIWSKAIALTIIALPICFGIVFSAHGFNFDYVAFLIAVVLTSILFALLGFIGVAHVRSFNQYIIIIPLFLAPTIVPLLELFNIWTHPLIYLIPSEASLLLFKAVFEDITIYQWIYSIAYLIFWLFVAGYFAGKSHKKRLIIC